MRKRHGFMKFYMILIIIALLIIFAPKGYQTLKREAAVQVMDRVVTEISELKTDQGKAIKFEEVYEKLDEKEKEKIDQLVEEYITPETIKDVTEIVKEGMNSDTKEKVMEYAKEKVSSEDVNYLMELYEKYK